MGFLLPNLRRGLCSLHSPGIRTRVVGRRSRDATHQTSCRGFQYSGTRTSSCRATPSSCGGHYFLSAYHVIYVLFSSVYIFILSYFCSLQPLETELGRVNSSSIVTVLCTLCTFSAPLTPPSEHSLSESLEARNTPPMTRAFILLVFRSLCSFPSEAHYAEHESCGILVTVFCDFGPFLCLFCPVAAVSTISFLLLAQS